MTEPTERNDPRHVTSTEKMGWVIEFSIKMHSSDRFLRTYTSLSSFVGFLMIFVAYQNSGFVYKVPIIVLFVIQVGVYAGTKQIYRKYWSKL